MTESAAAAAALVGGWVAHGFEPVAEAFERNFTERRELGAAFAASVDGRPVVDLWGGLADRRRQVAWSEDTLVGIFSGSKGLVATCILLLIDRGQLDLDAPVCAYWPEFAQHGKDRIRVRHLVSHRSGLPGVTTPITIADATDDVRMATLLARQAPITPPGAWHCYHAMTFGWLCGELIRRVDGRSIGRLLREEIASPLGLACWIGLPASLDARVAVFDRGPAFGFRDGATLPEPRTDGIAWSVWDNPPRFVGTDLAANMRTWRAAEIPATNAIVSARSMARLYACLATGGQLDGVRLMSRDTIDLGRRRLAEGHDPYLGVPIAFGVGFQLQTDTLQLGPPHDAFGHAGAGGSVHGAWPSSRTAFSYAMNRLARVGGTDERAAALLEALHAAVMNARHARDED